MDDIGKIYELYGGRLVSYLVGMTDDPSLAEELASEVFVRAMTGLGGFRGNGSVFTWLCAIGKNLYFDHLKKQGKRVDIENIPELSDSCDIQTELSDKQLCKSVHRRLHQLDEPYKEVFTLRVFGELSFGEIGSLFGRTDSWARVTFFRAKAKIIEELKEDGYEL